MVAGDCAVNSYTISGLCLPCPVNSTSLAGSIGLGSCTCAANHFGPSGGPCPACPLGSQSGAGAAMCTGAHAPLRSFCSVACCSLLFFLVVVWGQTVRASILSIVLLVAYASHTRFVFAFVPLAQPPLAYRRAQSLSLAKQQPLLTYCPPLAIPFNPLLTFLFSLLS